MNQEVRCGNEGCEVGECECLWTSEFFGTEFSVGPAYSFGRVHFKNSGVSVWCVVNRFLVDEHPKDIANDYRRLTEAEVLAGIKFWLTRRRKKTRAFIALGRREDP